MNGTNQDLSRNVIGKPYVVEGQVVEITNTKYDYMDERIFHRCTKTTDATNLGILVDGKVIPVMYPDKIDYKTCVSLLHERVRYTQRVGYVNKPEDFMQEPYKINKYSLEILSGIRKDEKHVRKFVT